MRKHSTIANGDCLFAAFLMAYKRKRFSQSEQKRISATLREQVADHILDEDKYIISRPLENVDVARIQKMNPNVSKRNLRNASNVDVSNFDASVQKWKRAYSRIIRTPGVWGGGIEIAVLADLFEVQITIFSDTDIYTEGHVHADNGTVYLYYEGNNHYSAMY